jgi:hypothetical protein
MIDRIPLERPLLSLCGLTNEIPLIWSDFLVGPMCDSPSSWSSKDAGSCSNIDSGGVDQIVKRGLCATDCWLIEKARQLVNLANGHNS